MSQPIALVIARPTELDAWEPALRARGLSVVRAERRRKGAPPPRETPSVVVISEKLPFGGALRATRDLRKGPATRELPVVLVGVQPFTTAQRLRLGVSAPDATVPRGATPEQVAEAVVEASRKGRLPPVELTPAQRAGMKYSRIGTLLMMFGVIFSFPSMGPQNASSHHDKAWFILLIPLGGLVSDLATGRVDGRRRLLSWQGWAALVIMVGVGVGLLAWPGFFDWANR
jgi:hypothetical protein